MTDTDYPKLIFTAGFDERIEFEMSARGYLSHVLVELEDGCRYEVYFYDPTRLRQDLESYINLGMPCLAEVGLIVLPEVTLENIKKSVNYLWKDGFFSRLKPISS